jgi:hypothetical protein
MYNYMPEGCSLAPLQSQALKAKKLVFTMLIHMHVCNCGEMTILVSHLQAPHTFSLEIPWEIRALGSQDEIIRHESTPVPPIVLLSFYNPCYSVVTCFNGRMVRALKTSTLNANIDFILKLTEESKFKGLVPSEMPICSYEI